MNRTFFAVASLALLIGCSSTNPFTGTGTDTGTDTGTGSTDGIPTELAGDLQQITYSPGDATITVRGITLDEVPFESIYQRKPLLDAPGYQAYAAQDDPLDRHTTAYVAQSGNSGAVRAGTVVTGGQFNRVFHGGYYERDGAYRPPAVSPTSGLVSYAGNYVGLTNGPGAGDDLLPVPVGTPTALIPREAGEITGEIFLNVDFADGAVNGAVYNRNLRDANGGAGLVLPDIVLISTAIATDGTFHGTEVEYRGEVGSDIGDYGGIFGGPDAEAIGGTVALTEWDGKSDALGIENELEWGVFVLNQCGTPDANATVCAGVK